MASTTPDLQFRYPVSTDKIAQGAQNIEDLAEDVENNTILATNAFAATDPHTSYPIGASTMAVSNSNGWPYGGVVHTIRRLGGTYSMQFFTYQSASVSRLGTLLRYGYQSGTAVIWSAWQTIVGNGSPDYFAEGTITAPTTGGGVVPVKVTFPSGRFTQIPNTQVTCVTSRPDVTNAGVADRSTTGMTIYVYRVEGSSSNTTVDWIATQVGS